ncbi:DUF2637 domain-containing protein [Streptomyces cinereoruber]|uniref:DUF2637 domain-containing protein n=1 Tax=Streptomyces cinereoruber TaxID=67260 RepID=UPI003C2E8C58
MAAMQLTRTHRVLIGLVIAGALIIAGIGFAGSYAAVRELAVHKGFGTFSYFFPIGIDAGICVLLALDLLLTWLRIPFPLLRQTAWVLTAATIAFNGAAAWPDPLGVGMHAVIPVLFVVAVEAARHAVGRIADITADKHMEGVRLTRWLLSPIPTFRLWRRMKLWELRSYEQVIKLEQERMIYQARLQARFGRNWRRKAPVEALMPLRLARYGVPLAETAAAGLAAAGIEPAVLPPQQGQAYEQLPSSQSPQPVQSAQPAQLPQQSESPQPAQLSQASQSAQPPQQSELPQQFQHPQQVQQAQASQGPQQLPQQAGLPRPDVPVVLPVNHDSPWFDTPEVSPKAYTGTYNLQGVEGPEPVYGPVPQGAEGYAEHQEQVGEHAGEYAGEQDPRGGRLHKVVHDLVWEYAREHEAVMDAAEAADRVAAEHGGQEYYDPEHAQQLIFEVRAGVQEALAARHTT